MSVDVKTPTRTQFEHPEFPCGERRDTSPHLSVGFENVLAAASVSRPSTSELPDPSVDGGATSSNNPDCSGGRFPRKRRLSERGGAGICHPSRKRTGRFGKAGEKIVLPSKFLLGGNITDPLNLNALYDNEIGRMLNEKTPQSSPLPLPEYKQQVQVLIPPNINDPLNLNSTETDVGLTSPKFGNKKKKHKHKKKRSSVGAGDKSDLDTTGTGEQGDNDQSEDVQPDHLTQPVYIDTALSKETTPISSQKHSDVSEKLGKLVDKIVSPVIPQLTPKKKKVPTATLR